MNVRSEAGPRKNDLATVVAIAVVAYALANILHEAVGHGGACLAVGGKPRMLTSISFEGDTEGLSRAATRLIQAGGTAVNLLAAALALVVARLSSRASGAVRFFLWLLATVNLLQATGYFLFSGLAGVGDWAAFAADVSPVVVPRLVLAVVGGLGYWYSLKLALLRLAPFLGRDAEQRLSRGVLLTVVPYVTGGVFYTVAGLFNPYGMAIVLISAVAASIGGTSGLAWGAQLLRGPAGLGADASGAPAVPLTVERSWGFLATAAVLAVVFTVVLGPGLRLG